MIRIYRDGEPRDVAHVYRGFRQEVPEVRKWHGGAMRTVHSRIVASVDGGTLGAKIAKVSGTTLEMAASNVAVAGGVLEIG